VLCRARSPDATVRSPDGHRFRRCLSGQEARRDRAARTTVAAADDGHVVLAMTDRPLRSVRRRAQRRSPPRGRRTLLLRGGPQVLSGGEPFVLQSTKAGTYVFTAHEGTTLLYRPGVENGIGGDLSYLGDYRNQVGIWTSSDGGLNWTPVNWNNTMFFTNPLIN